MPVSIVDKGTIGPAHGITRAFSDAGVLNLGRDIPVKLRLILASLGLALLLAGSMVVPLKTSAQDNAADASKRKVRVKIAPEYPALAKQMNVTGKVKIEATVAADGHVTGTRVVGGSPLLVNSALDALKKWHFEPAAKESTEIVEFAFSGQE
ncbi:MAG TPA: energy transducer TonB [Candidatus Acidoferrales bacterium]|nr:energy transducer TonB [Candidatus Acidoferrales bacterium]